MRNAQLNDNTKENYMKHTRLLEVICISCALLWGCGDDSSSGKDNQPPECGNGRVETGENCDDGNTESGDGCSADCSAAEDGDWCPGLGGACEKSDDDSQNNKPRCGNGKV